MKITRIGLDLAKNVFQVFGGCPRQACAVASAQAQGDANLLPGLAACLIGMEACASAHYWAWVLTEMGHTVKLIAPQFVKPLRQRQQERRQRCRSHLRGRQPARDALRPGQDDRTTASRPATGCARN